MWRWGENDRLCNITIRLSKHICFTCYVCCLDAAGGAPQRSRNAWWCTICLASQMLSIHPPLQRYISVNSLAPVRFQFTIRKVIFKLTLVNGGWSISYEIALRWMPQDLTDDKSTLVQVMTWCRRAKSHYLCQCWPRSMSPNGVTRPQWVNTLRPSDNYTGKHWFR